MLYMYTSSILHLTSEYIEVFIQEERHFLQPAIQLWLARYFTSTHADNNKC